MTFSIVEFEEGNFNVVCTKWLYKEKGVLKCYWPNAKMSMEYYKIVKKLTTPDVTKWEKAIVTNILGRYESYDIARIKLKDAEMHTDIATDPESRGKEKRRKKNTYRYGFSTDAEDNILKKKISKQTYYKEKINLSLPEPPKELTQFKCTTSRGKENTLISVEPGCSSKEQSIHTAEDKNTFIPRIEPLRKNDRNVSPLTINPLSELMDKDTAVPYKQSYKLPSFQSKSKSVSINKLFSNDILKSIENEHETGAAMSNINNNNGSNTSLKITADIIEHGSVSSAEMSDTADTLTKGRQGLQLQQLLQDDESFKKFVISELLKNASYRKKFLVHSSNKEHNEFHTDGLPCINNVNSLEQFDKELKTNQAYRKTVILLMSKIGGTNVKKITMAIIGRIIHCTLAKQYSWKGGKGKLKFCLLNGLISAIICATRHTKHAGKTVAADATEEDVIIGIKEFLRQSIGRAKTWEAKQQNERNPDEHISETEEVSTSNETDEESDGSVTEDNTNKRHFNINKKRNFLVEDSDDDSS